MKSLSIVVVLIFLFTPFFVQATNFQLLIVEVQIAGEKADHDFIKIYNPSPNELDISGYKLRKRSSTGGESSIRVLPKGSKIGGKGYFLWANSKDDFHLFLEANVWSKSTLAKNNSIALLDPENVIVDALAWGESQNPFVKGKAFPENPGPNQQLKRKRIGENYQNTNDNSQDFYLEPIIEISQKEKESQPNKKMPLEKGSSTPENEKIKEPLKIDINTASLKDLMKIVHLGGKRNQELISLRPFYSLDELMKIKGIDQKALEDIKKQGLAWVDSTLQPPKIEKAELKDQELTSLTGSLENEYSPQEKKKPFAVFLIALTLAIFSGTTILILKKKIKNYPEGFL